MAECVEPVIQNLDMSITNVHSVVSESPFTKYWSKRIYMGFKPNNGKDEKEKAEFICNYNAHLFLPFRRNTIANFRSYILKSAATHKAPTLFGIIDTMDLVGNSIFLTQCISDIVCWMKFVRKRLNGCISKKDMEQKNEADEYVYSAQWLLTKCREENLGDPFFWKEKCAAFVNCFNHVASRITKRAEAEVPDVVNMNGIESICDILLGDDLPTAPIEIISPSNSRKRIEPRDVPLLLCINYNDDGGDTSPIHAILRHLVSVNELLLRRCRPHQNHDTISLRNISQREDCVDIDETEFIGFLQNCTQQSLEYGVTSTFSMNLSLLEAQLYERYIVDKKLIDYNRNALLFTFAGQRNIKSCVDEINYLYDRNREAQYFEDCPSLLLDKVLYDKLESKSQKETKNELQLIAVSKQAIEQTLVAILRWPTVPNRDVSISDFMKNNLKLFEDEYQLFIEINKVKQILLLKHCQ
eukprot:709899_1